MIKPTLQKPITIDSLQKYSIKLEVYAHSLEVDYKELEDSRREIECKLSEITKERDSIIASGRKRAKAFYSLREECENLKKEKESLYLELEVYKKVLDKMLVSVMQLNTSEENGELYKNLSNAFGKLSKNLEGAMIAMMHNAVSSEENEKENKEDE